MSEYWRCTTKDQLENCFKHLRDNFPAEGWRVEYKAWKDRRSTNANSLYWKWLTLLAEHFSKGTAYSQDDMHDLMRHKFLGYVDAKKIGNTEIPQQLASTTGLDTGQMHAYMSKIDALAADHGCLLPHPADSAYTEYKEAQV